MEWKSLFRSRILERGYDYYLDGKVDIKSVGREEIKADVFGTDAYNVVIDIDNDRIFDMKCNCPYALDGKYCKHMAAVLYERFGDDIDKTGGAFDNVDHLDKLMRDKELRYEETERLLQKIPNSERHKILVDYIANNSELRNTLKMQYDFVMDARQLLQLRQEIDRIVDEHYYDGFIDYSHAWDFCCALDRFLDTRMKLLIEKGALLSAFELTNSVFKIIATIDIDDYDGGTAMVAGKCYSIWKEIYRNAKEDEKETIKEWFHSYKEGDYIDWYEEYLYEFRNIELASQEDIKELMMELDKKIDSRGNSNDCGEIFTISEGRVSLIDRRIEFMHKLGMSQQDIDEYCDNHMQFCAVRVKKIESATQDKDYDKAIELLVKSKKLDVEEESLISYYSESLIELYRITGRKDEYIAELRFNLLNCHQSDERLFVELKKYLGQEEEWEGIVDRIINNNKYGYAVYDIFVEEERYEQMMDMIERSDNVYALDERKRIMSKEVPERVINFYADYAKKSMCQASYRKAYRNAIRCLENMSFSPTGKARAQEIADGWKVEYRRRSALLDELKKAGF